MLCSIALFVSVFSLFLLCLFFVMYVFFFFFQAEDGIRDIGVTGVQTCALPISIHKMSDDWFQRMLDIHLVAPFRIIRAAAPHLREPAKKEREEGREVFRKIVNVSSTSGMNGNAGQANYSAGKLGIVGLTKTLAKEWGQFKVNCNAVAFGFIETRLTAAKADENVMEIDGEKVQLGIPEQLRGMGTMLIPLGRAGTPEEAAGGIFLLCTPWANFKIGRAHV